MDRINLADKSAKEAPLLMVEAVYEEGKEVAAYLTVGVRLINLARHLDRLNPCTPLYPPPGFEAAGQNRKGSLKSNAQSLHCAWMEI